MSYTTGTAHYNLPQTTGTDKRDWSDTNQAFQDIDAALYQTTQDTAQAALDIEALEVRMDTAEQNIATNAGDIAALDGRVTTVEGTVAQHTTQIGDVRTDLEDMICAYNEASATSTHAYVVGDYFIYNDVLYRAIQAIAIGDTIVPDTNCTTTNVTSEIKHEIIRVVSADGIKTRGQLIAELLTHDIRSMIVNNFDMYTYKVRYIIPAGNEEEYTITDHGPTTHPFINASETVIVRDDSRNLYSYVTRALTVSDTFADVINVYADFDQTTPTQQALTFQNYTNAIPTDGAYMLIKTI